MFMAQIGIIPQQVWYHDPNMQDNYGQTVALLLTKNGMDVPELWRSKPEIQNSYGYTVALYQAKNGKMPDTYWQHDIYLRAKIKIEGQFYYYTVQNFLQYNQINVPKYWQYVQIDNEDNNFPISEAIQGIIPQYLEQYNPGYQNKKGNTVAMYLSVHDFIPPKEWQHDKNLTNSDGFTVADILHQRWIITPNHWQTYNQSWLNNEIFEDVIYNISSPRILQSQNENNNQIQQIDYSQQNYEKFTIPMAIIQCWNQIPPDHCYHDPKIQNIYGETVAMILAHYNKQISQKWYHDPEIQNIENETVALIQAGRLDKIPDTQWEHRPDIQDSDLNTVAMYLAGNGVIPPKQWEHDPLLRNQDGQTVGILLAQQGIIPPDCWLHDIEIEDNQNYSIKRHLFNFDYINLNNQFIPNCHTVQTNDICQLCLNGGKQDFVKSFCGHFICIECFKELMKQKMINYCPICKMKEWYQKIITEGWQGY